MINISVTSVNDHTIVLGAAAGAGETSVAMEIGRSPDFLSDETIAQTAGSLPAAFTWAGLLADTYYFFRARAATIPPGSWSTVLSLKTAKVTENLAFAGFSIEPALLVIPEPITLSNDPFSPPGFPITNLGNDDPVSVWRASGTGGAGHDFYIDTAGGDIDVVSLLGTSFNHQALWHVRSFASAANRSADTSPLYNSTQIAIQPAGGLNGRRFIHALLRLPAVRTERFWAIRTNNVQFPYATVRHCVMGKARTSVNYSRGAGQQPLDYGKFSRTRFGTPDRVRGWRGRKIDFELSWLREAEYETKWAPIDRMVGGIDPVLVIANPKANAFLNDRIGYGTITSTRNENVRSNRYSKMIEIESLY